MFDGKKLEFPVDFPESNPLNHREEQKLWMRRFSNHQQQLAGQSQLSLLRSHAAGHTLMASLMVWLHGP
jgi:hypothetical protein